MQLKKNSGFTLVEMAIVLVIIGIILAGVMKGRDIVRGAQVKQFSQGYAQKWQTIAATFQDKTGQAYCDGANNGGHGTQPAADGLMDNLFMNYRAAANQQDALNALRDVGITPCTLIKTDLEDWTNGCGTGNNYNIWSRTVEGEFSGRMRADVGFAAVQIPDPDGGGLLSVRNCVVFTNVPVDVAKGLDTLIDGQANGRIGACMAGELQDTTAYADASNSPYWDPGAGNIVDELVTNGLNDWGDAESGQLATVLLVLDY